jgi:hypothetical protein
VRYEAHAPPAWLPDGSAVLVTGRPAGGVEPAADLEAPVGPLEPTGTLEVVALEVSTATLTDSGFGPGARVAALAPDGRIAYLRADGSLRIADGPGGAGVAVRALAGERIGAVSFAPGEDAAVVVLMPEGTDATGGRLERIELDDGRRSILANDGWRPRWLP